MKTWHVHITGRVQGVGFRPFVGRLAAEMGVKGWVCNAMDGVHIHFNADQATTHRFYHHLVNQPPEQAVIRSHHIEQIPDEHFRDFSIRASDHGTMPNLLLTPDAAMCAQCRKELHQPGNRRYRYPFTTCTQCGPRYSIQQRLPYDRAHTTMAALPMCTDCEREYHSAAERRYYSQTNSCSCCSIPVHLYDATGNEISNDTAVCLSVICKALLAGDTVAVKGIGGYLLLCDATNAEAVTQLRERKQRPRKPLALLYPGVDAVKGDVLLTSKERTALLSSGAPVVLCRLKEMPLSGLAAEQVAPSLDKVGIMLPYTPLLDLIAADFKKPLVATSGNLHGSPIIYRDADARRSLGAFADYILCFERDIVVPQDDSVMQYSDLFQQPLMLRRSRGWAPDYHPSPFHFPEPVLAMGAEIKSAFAVAAGEQLFISQYLGDQSVYESQEAYDHTLQHLLRMLAIHPRSIITDLHPQYFVTERGRELADEWLVPVQTVQHHEAHFAAVLAENGLLFTDTPVLGIIWDGNGYGTDGHSWGGECFLFEQGSFDRLLHLDYFPLLQGDSMGREPRLSALALLREEAAVPVQLRNQFSPVEWAHYKQLLQQHHPQLTSAMGRLLDGIAAIIGCCSRNSYEGEAAMQLEALARRCRSNHYYHYPLPFQQGRINWSVMVEAIVMDMKMGVEAAVIARKVWVSLAMLIRKIAQHTGIRRIAFSGGVFQNALLTDLIRELVQGDADLIFHRQLSPNDECISFGQLAVAALREQQLSGVLAADKIVPADHKIQPDVFSYSR